MRQLRKDVSRTSAGRKLGERELSDMTTENAGAVREDNTLGCVREDMNEEGEIGCG
jgi:hypothetical protein